MVRFLFIILLASLIGCQQTLVSESPVESPLAPAATPVDLLPTQAVRDVATRAATLPSVTDTSAPLLSEAATLLPAATATLPPDAIIVGQSAEGRAIVARQIGKGPRIVLLVGGIHGGWEGNTVTLVNELMTHFEANPEDILPGMALMFVPAANPDGLVKGRTEEGRFSADGVDLNRNWNCEWSVDARWRDQAVDAGPTPFSEPETRALSAFIQNLRPATALFYHSAAGGVYAGSCEGDHGSAEMSQIYGQAAGYSYGEVFSAYPVTGTAASWVDGLGIPSADVELMSWTDSEFARNLAGLMALQYWLTQT